jgi:hypothetical protein
VSGVRSPLVIMGSGEPDCGGKKRWGEQPLCCDGGVRRRGQKEMLSLFGERESKRKKVMKTKETQQFDQRCHVSGKGN